MASLDDQDWSRLRDVPALVSRLYEVVEQLEEIFPGRHFTPDGHLLGSLGESLAEYLFDLKLITASTAAHDAVTTQGVRVEIKATQAQRVSVSAAASPSPEERLLVLRFGPRQPPEIVYNGPADRVWTAAGSPQKNGQRTISLKRLRTLNAAVDDEDRLDQARELDLGSWAGGPSG